MSGPREQIQQIFHVAVEAVDPRSCVRRAFSGMDEGGRLSISGQEIAVGSEEIHLIAIGKAADFMAQGAIDALGERVTQGIVVTKERASGLDDRFLCLQGSHPVPDGRSLRAGEAVLEFAAAVPDGGLVVCLISGGGSALAEALEPGVELEDLQHLTSSLLRAGAPIEDLNAVRSRLSRFKGGGLLGELQHARIVNLIVSDVLGDNLQAIASGPTVPRSEGRTAEDVLDRYSIEFELPPTGASSDIEPVATLVVANLAQAIEAAASEAEMLGLRPVVLADKLEGEARVVGATLASILAASGHSRSPLKAGDCVLAGGETTVTVRGDGKGGRNTEAALAAALELQGIRHVTAGFLATDGDDGVTRAAGAIVDGATISLDDTARALEALDANDSYSFLVEAGAVWEPGATGTNVNDLVIAIIE